MEAEVIQLRDFVQSSPTARQIRPIGRISEPRIPGDFHQPDRFRVSEDQLVLNHPHKLAMLQLMILNRAKEQLRGKFVQMIGTAKKKSKLSFGYRSANMFMKIAEDSRLRNVRHVSHLPPDYRMLYDSNKD